MSFIRSLVVIVMPSIFSYVSSIKQMSRFRQLRSGSFPKSRFAGTYHRCGCRSTLRFSLAVTRRTIHFREPQRLIPLLESVGR